MPDTIKNTLKSTKRIFYIASGCIVVLLGLYFYFVGHTIYSVSLRGHVEKAIVETGREATRLELGYVNLKNSITEDDAKESGYVSLAQADYISRTPQGRELSLNTSQGF
ncbi:MAG: hypothetical protein NUV54_00775 [Candidatus Taylorbacteria bacterium]|nr:hypothetical protein [Candidatus Taylorbacteria bacterium]